MLFTLAGMLGAATYVIGTGTSYQNRAPVNGANDYGWCKMIYTKAEINAAGLASTGSITGIGLQVDNFPINYTFYNQHIFIRHLTASAYTQTNEPLPDSTSFSYVFSSAVTFQGDGWLQVAFSTPFEWDNVRNIEVLWKNWDGERQENYPQFRFTTSSPNYRAVYNHADGSFPTSSGTRYYNRPNLQIITAMAPEAALAVYPADNRRALNTASLIWKSGGGCPTSYDVYLDTVNPPVTLVSEGQTGTSFNPALLPNTTYYWRIVPSNPYGSPAVCPVWNFHTTTATQLTESFESAVFPPLGWDNPGTFYSSPNYPYHGSTCVFALAGTTGNLLGTPLLSLRSGSYLNFQARTTTTSGNARLRIKYSPDRETWSVLGSPISLPTSSAWQNIEIDLSALAGNTCYLGVEAFNAGSSGTVYVFLDHIIGPDPAGLIPTPELSISRVGNDVHLAWTAVPEAASYAIYASDDPYDWPSTPLLSVGPAILTHTVTSARHKFYRVAAIAE